MLRAWACVVVVVAIGCKSRGQISAETFERAACGCWHHDVRCARAALHEYEDGTTTRARWYERDDFYGHEQAGYDCADRVVSCTDADPCNPDQRCDPSVKHGFGACSLVVGEGEDCNGLVGDTCRDGLECWSDDPLAKKGVVCDDPSCSRLPGGICVKPATSK